MMHVVLGNAVAWAQAVAGINVHRTVAAAGLTRGAAGLTRAAVGRVFFVGAYQGDHQ